jgi:NTE family protein
MRALVLSGGAAKGGYQVGVLNKWILKDETDYDIFIGTSIGNLNGGFLAQAPRGELPIWQRKLDNLWRGFKNDDVYRKWFFCELAAVWKWSVYNTEGARNIIHSNIDPDALCGSGRKFRTVYVSWRTGAVQVGTEQDSDIRDKMYASASFPVFFEPAVVDGELCTDGGVRDIAPIGLALELGASEVDVVLCSNPDSPDDWSTNMPGVLPYALRTVDIMSTEILLNDVKMCLLKNRLPEYAHVELRLVKPTRPLGDSFDFSSKQTERRIEIGYEDACDL